MLAGGEGAGGAGCGEGAGCGTGVGTTIRVGAVCVGAVLAACEPHAAFVATAHTNDAARKDIRITPVGVVSLIVVSCGVAFDQGAPCRSQSAEHPSPRSAAACATLLLAQGVNPRVVMETLGHSQVSLTLNTYSHVLPALHTTPRRR